MLVSSQPLSVPELLLVVLLLFLFYIYLFIFIYFLARKLMLPSAKKVDQIIEKINLELEPNSFETTCHNNSKICTICHKRVHKNQKATTCSQ